MSRCLFFLSQVYGGMRGMKGLVYETSVLDPDEVSMAQSIMIFTLVL